MALFDPLHSLAEYLTFSLFRINQASYLGEAVSYFIFDVLRIGLLLVAINYFMAFTRYYFPMEKVRDLLTKKRWYGLDYLAAAILGVITPFCSCSSIPLFVGFLSAGVPLGITMTFLIASPLVNESSLFLFPAIFGLQTTLTYNLVGILISLAGGLLINRLKLEKYLEPSLLQFKKRPSPASNWEKLSLPTLLKLWWEDGWGITKSVFPYVVMGVAIGAVIHGFVPATLVEKYLGVRAWWSVPLATLIGVPLYAGSVSVIPIAEALIGKGIPLGTVLAFMTATVTLSVPEALILKKVMKWQLLAIFFGITTFGIMLLGYLFNSLS